MNLKQKQFIIEVTETYCRKIKLSAMRKDEALAIVEQRYIAGDIRFNANDLVYSKVDYAD
jgi:hypothetical protein